MNARIGGGAALIAASCAVGAIAMQGGFTTFDAHVLRAMSVADRGPAWLTETTSAITTFGDVGIRSLVVVGVIAALLWRHRWRSGALYLATIALSIGGHTLAKLFWDRERPALVRWLDDPHDLSFPSGHSAGSMVVLLLAALLFDRWRAAPIAVALAIVIGLTRPMLGVHWPTDVIGGWLWGAGFALIGAGVAQSMGWLDVRYAVKAVPHNTPSPRA